jgi:hypothetical protein
MATLKINYTISFGANLRIGYRIQNSSSPFTYIPTYPTYNESPYEISDLAVGTYEVELTTICPNCGGGVFADPVVYPAIVL